MRDLSVDDVVRLAKDLPNLNLHRGQAGVVRSLWFTPGLTYEVEFTGLDEHTRAVLVRDQITCDSDETSVVGSDRKTFDSMSSVGVW